MAITEATVRRLASGQSFERGEDYYYSGSVYSIQKRGDMVIAEVQGSSYEPYQVTIELAGDEIISTECSCPYDWGGVCKHIVAALLAYVHKPEEVVERVSAEELLAGLGEADLRGLLLELLEAEPHLIDRIETKLATRSAAATPQPAPAKTAQTGQVKEKAPPIDPAPFRRQARQIMRGSDRRDYYGVPDIEGEMSRLLDQAQPFLAAGDGRNALLILEAIVEPYVESWFEFDDSDGEMGTLFEEIGQLLAEAILSADLTPAERRSWAEKLTEWQGEIEDYGIDEGFDVAIAAAEQGWDYPPLRKVLDEGQITEKGAWEDESPWYADELAIARLNVLERQGRTTEYLYLAEAEGQTALYLTMLVKLGRIQEAVEYATKYLATSEEALAMAQALRERGHLAEALKIGEQGLAFQDQTLLMLARWLRDLAVEMSQSEVALKAGQEAFHKSFSLEDYKAVETIAGAKWPALKPKLLDQLAAASYAFGRIDIYLYEGMIDEAIKVVDRREYYGYDILEKVVEAAWQSRPDWVIQQCKRQAEEIMDQGKSNAYHHAVDWLEKARRAYQAAQREAEWRSYLEGLIQKHARKYSLRPQLEKLRK
jgi:uncharacterized Zn finger protein